ncbi:hypothetical protein PUR32_06675 [Streptomyces sp. BE133]|nr:hypothetical protein [Streptomyces sp. BE133]
MPGDGYVPADDLRDDKNVILREHSAALKRALQRGCIRGLRPAEMKAPDRQPLRGLATAGVLTRTDPKCATYRFNEQ